MYLKKSFTRYDHCRGNLWWDLHGEFPVSILIDLLMWRKYQKSKSNFAFGSPILTPASMEHLSLKKQNNNRFYEWGYRIEKMVAIRILFWTYKVDYINIYKSADFEVMWSAKIRFT